MTFTMSLRVIEITSLKMKKTIQEYQNEIANFQKYYKDVTDIDDYPALIRWLNERKDSYTWDNDLDFESLKKSLLSSIEHSVEELQNKVQELLDSNKSELNLIDETDKAQDDSQEFEAKKTAMSKLKFGESLTIEHDCKNLMEIKIQTDKGSKTLHFKLPQSKE
ncbi:hypothetical protein ID0082_09300 [Helicobacter pylori]